MIAIIDVTLVLKMVIEPRIKKANSRIDSGILIVLNLFLKNENNSIAPTKAKVAKKILNGRPSQIDKNTVATMIKPIETIKRTLKLFFILFNYSTTLLMNNLITISETVKEKRSKPTASSFFFYLL